LGTTNLVIFSRAHALRINNNKKEKAQVKEIKKVSPNIRRNNVYNFRLTGELLIFFYLNFKF